MAEAIVMPKLGMVMEEGTILRWTKQKGELVNKGEVIAEIETEKLNYELEAVVSGIFHPIVEEGASVLVNGIAGYLLEEGESPPEIEQETKNTSVINQAQSPKKNQRSKDPTKPTAGIVKSTPGARKLAAKMGVDLGDLVATGPGGRIVEEDVRKHMESKDSPATSGASKVLGTLDIKDSKNITGMRKSIADHMKSSLANAAQLSFSLEVDVTDAQKARRDYSSGDGVNISLTSLIIKACTKAIEQYPDLNTIIHEGKIHYFDQVNVGLAVALKEGLIVTFIRNADKKSVEIISQEAQELSDNGRKGKLDPDHLTNGTFTVSSLGMVDSFTPILNNGQSAILGVGRTQNKPVVVGNEIVIREMITLSLTVDHQVIDGAVAAGFFRRVQRYIEKPIALLDNKK